MVNIALDLKNDKGLREDDLFQPFKLVSLWDMLRFYAERFVWVSHDLGRFLTLLEFVKHQKPATNARQLLTADLLIQLVPTITDIQQMGLSTSSTHAMELLYTLNGTRSIKLDVLRERMDRLMDSLRIELERELFLRVPPRRAQHYHRESTFLGENVIRKFQELTYDAQEVDNCFALGRWTACVFHSMRILELVLRKFARKLKISPSIFERKDWGIILDRINKELEHKPTDSRKVKEKKDKYKITHGFLNGVRMAWRNDTIHVRADYDEEGAVKVMNAVKLFVEDFARLR